MDSASDRILLEPYKYLLQLPGETSYDTTLLLSLQTVDRNSRMNSFTYNNVCWTASG